MSRGMEDVLRGVEAAAETVRDAAAGVPEERWAAALAPSRWSSAEVLEHLSLANETLLRELRGGPGMAVRTTPLQRLLLRISIRPRILRKGRFPSGARAPREVRPEGELPGRAASMERFDATLAALLEESRAALEDGRRVRLTHAYFGGLTLRDGLRFTAAHLRHHARQLPVS